MITRLLQSVTHWYCRHCGQYIGTTKGGDGEDKISLTCVDCYRQGK